MKHLLLRNAFTLKALLLVSMIVGAVSGAWAEDFVKVTSTSDLSYGGEYILVAESANKALSGISSTSTPYGTGVDVTISEGTISTDAALVFVLQGGKTNGWTFYSSSNSKYLSWSSGNSLKLDGTEYKWTIDFSGGNVAIVSVKDTSRKIRWNSGSPRFACYTSEQTDIQLYKKASNPLPDPELSFSTDVVNAVFGGDFELPTLNTASGFDGTVEYSSSDETVAQIMDPETGDLRILKGGTTTITATFAGNENFKSGSASYTLNVTDNRIATSISCDPIELDINDVGTLTMLRPVVLDAEGNVVEYTNSPDAEGLPEVYFETMDEENPIIGSFDSHGNIVLNSVEGTVTIKAVYNHFQLNKNYQPSECTFTITVTAPFTGGDVTFVSSDDNTTETSLTKKVVTISGSKLSSSYYQAYKNSDFTISTSAGKITKIVFTCTSSNPASGFATKDGFTIDGDNGTWIGRAESVTFTASNLQVRATQIVVTVDMREESGLSFDESASFNAVVGEEFTAPTLANPHELIVYYESDNEDVATVDPATGAVTLVGAGDATITATFEGDDTYSEGSASYTIKVTAANQVATPVIAFGAETFFESTTATITCATEGATIFYSTDNGENWQTYSEAIILTETTTIIAKATKEGATDSQICEAATATKNSVEADLATLAAKEAGTYYVNLNNVVVTYVNGNNAYLQDASGAILLYKNGHGFTAGQVINGVASVTLQIRSNNPQLTTLTGAEGYSVVDGTAPEPTTVAVDEWDTPINTVLGQYLKVTGATITSESSKYYVQLGEEKVQLYGQGDARTISVEDLEATYTIVGFPTVFNTTPELQIFVQPEKEEAVDERAVVILSFEKDSYEATVGQDFEEPTLSVKDESGTPIEGLTITYTYHSETTPPAVINESGEVTIIEPGEIVFTAVFEGNDTYQPATASYTLIVKSQPKTNPELAFSENNCTVTIGADDNIFPTLNNPYDVAVKYTSSNTAVATVGGSTGDITLVGAGETTITASFAGNDEYEAGEATYILTVNKALPVGLVYDALEYGFIEVTGTTYVDWSDLKAISGAVYAGNSAAGNNAIQLRSKDNAGIITTASSGTVYHIVVEWNENTTAGRKLNFYGSNTAYSSPADLYDNEKQGTLIGTTVFDADNSVANIYVEGDYQYIGIRSDNGALYLDKVSVGWLVKPAATLAFVDAANEAITQINLVKGETFTATLSTNLSSTDEVQISIQQEGVVSYEDGIITALDAGEATITATFAGNDSYRPASAELKVVVTDPNVPVDICTINGISPTSLTIDDTGAFMLDATFIEGVTVGEDYEVLWECSDPSILEVLNNGSYEAKAAGTVEITVKVKELVKTDMDKRFIDVEKKFTVTVYAPATRVQGALVAKLADDTYRAVTNDATTKKNWLVGREVTVINGKVLASEDDSDISWTITTRGDVTTFQDLDGNFISAPASGNNIGLADAASESTQWTVDGDSWTKLQGENQKTILWNNTNQGFRYYASSNIDNSGYSSAITYSEIVPGCTRTLSNTWGTVCFSRQVLVENTVNARFYWVAGKVLNEAGEPVKLILREEDWALKTGYPFIVEAIDPTAPVIMLFEEGELVEHALNMNGLYGTHTEREVPEGAYILYGGQFVKCGTGCSVAADRAYLKMEDVPVYEGDEAGVKVFNLGGEDGISSLDAASEGAVIYDLSGRRVSKTVKGLYIVNGKKVSVK